MADIGFIGTGIMGTPMAQNLQNAGHTVYFSEHYKPAPAELLGSNGKACATPAAVAEQAEFIITMLPDTPQVETVLFGEQGVAHGLCAKKIVIDMTSASPTATKEFASRVEQTGATYLDAPVSGGDVGAQQATLSIMVGGSEESFNKALPLFKAMGQNVSRVGDNGAGQTCKVANQIIVGLNIEAVAEALLFASKAGADPARVRTALMGGFAASKVLDVHGERMVTRNFQPGGRVRSHQKDLNLALSAAREMNLFLPNTAMAQQLFNSCVAHGGEEWDHSAMLKALELMANHEVA